MEKVDGLVGAVHGIDLTHIVFQVGIVGDALPPSPSTGQGSMSTEAYHGPRPCTRPYAQVGLEVLHVHGVKTHERHKQAHVRLGKAVAREVTGMPRKTR